MQRRLVRIAVLSALVFATLSLALRAQLGGAPAADLSSRPLPAGVALDRSPPPVTLLDEDGHRTSLAALRGRWVVLAPTLTLCHELCPITTGALLRLRSDLRAVGVGRRVAVIELSVDPWRDRPRRLRAFRRLSGASIPILTGSVADLRRLWRFFGVRFRRVAQGRPPDRDWLTGQPERFDVEHTDGLFLLDPGGRERVAIPGMPGIGGRLSGRLRSLLNSSGRANLAHPTAPWTPRAVAADLTRLIGVRRGPATAISPLATRHLLAGSPRPLSALHRQAGMLLGGDEGLTRRIAALRGFPIVVNAWASWCPPCSEELPLFAAASKSFGRRVAFLGADVEDDRHAARRLLGEIEPEYPSYSSSLEEMNEISSAEGTPFTVFIGAGGQVLGRHIGAYPSRADLDSDVRAYLRQP